MTTPPVFARLAKLAEAISGGHGIATHLSGARNDKREELRSDKKGKVSQLTARKSLAILVSESR